MQAGLTEKMRRGQKAQKRATTGALLAMMVGDKGFEPLTSSM
jgi:hypothetical protein